MPTDAAEPSRTEPAEPTFTVRGSDPDAAGTVRIWAEKYATAIETGARSPADVDRVTEALAVARDMESYAAAGSAGA